MKASLRVVWQVERGVAAAELAAVALALVVMLGAISLNVLSRNFKLPLPDLSEPALVCMSVAAFLGSAYAVYKGAHVAVELGALTARASKLLAWIVDASIVAMSGFVVVYGAEFLAYVISISESTPELGLPLAIPVGCMEAGAALSIFHVACRAARALGAGQLPMATVAIGKEKAT